MLLSDSSRVAPEAFRFRRTGMGLKVGLILPANGEADSSGHPEACGSQPLDLALIGNRQSCFGASETERALPIATQFVGPHGVSLSPLQASVKERSATLTASHWSILCRLRSSFSLLPERL